MRCTRTGAGLVAEVGEARNEEDAQQDHPCRHTLVRVSLRQPRNAARGSRGCHMESIRGAAQLRGRERSGEGPDKDGD